jgi:hypothetical protein
MSTPSVPAALRRAVEDDLQKVRPLSPVWARTLVAAAVAAVGVGLVLAFFKLSLRSDMGEIPIWLSWGCTALQLGVGVALIALALREAVPGLGVPARTIAVAIGTGVLMQVLVGVATWVHSPGVPYVIGRGLGAGLGCARHDLALALPALAVTLWLVFRALPLRPSVAGLLGGAGAAVVADALNHVVCPMSDLRHVLVWHTGALIGLMLLGFAVGALWERRRYPDR